MLLFIFVLALIAFCLSFVDCERKAARLPHGIAVTARLVPGKPEL